MSLIGLVNLTERLLNQSQDNGNDGDNSGKSAKQVTPQSVNNPGADEFRPSGANTEKEAGLFQVRQQSVFTAAATVLLVENGPAQTAASPSGTSANGNGTSSQPVATNATTQAAPEAVSNAVAPTTSDAEVLAQLQSLNSTLAALGLNQAEIDVIDRVAQLIKNFSPAAFTSLVNQLQILQQDTAQNAIPDDPAKTTAGTGQSNGGFTLDAFSIQFAGANETVEESANGANANGGRIQLSAFQLKASEVQLTLGNKSTGQTAQIQAPQTPQAAIAASA